MLLFCIYLLFLQHSVFIKYLRISYNAPQSQLLPIPPTSISPHILSGSLIKVPLAIPLKKTESFCTFLPKAIFCEELHFSIFNDCLSELFLLLSLLFLGVGGGRMLAHNPSMSFIFTYEFGVIKIIAKDASLSIAACGSMDHGHHMVFGSTMD